MSAHWNKFVEYRQMELTGTHFVALIALSAFAFLYHQLVRPWSRPQCDRQQPRRHRLR